MRSHHYILEANDLEFRRLERQSQSPNYDYRHELRNLKIKGAARILDAGCGSGIVTRYLAGLYPRAKVTGCDLSEARMRMAAEAAASLSNAFFETQDLSQLSYPDNTFDLAICRYVLQHVPLEARTRILAELYRVLKPGGTICVVDTDGVFANLAPQSGLVAEVTSRLVASGPIDFYVGRKIPAALLEAGFTAVERTAEIIDCAGETVSEEIELMRERLENAAPFFTSFLGAEKATRFCSEYLEAMSKPGSVYFFNKFVVTATKPSKLARVK